MKGFACAPVWLGIRAPANKRSLTKSSGDIKILPADLHRKIEPRSDRIGMQTLSKTWACTIAVAWAAAMAAGCSAQPEATQPPAAATLTPVLSVKELME